MGNYGDYVNVRAGEAGRKRGEGRGRGENACQEHRTVTKVSKSCPERLLQEPCSS